MGKPRREAVPLIADRRTRALTMRLSGADDVQIGRALRAPDPTDTSYEGFPGGYNPAASDDTRANHVRQDVVRALKIRRAAVAEKADEYRQLNRARLERLFLASSRAAYDGDATAVRNCVRIVSELCKLDGLYAPVKVEHTITDAERSEISGAVSELFEDIAVALGQTPD